MHPTIIAAVADERRRDLVRAARLARTPGTVHTRNAGDFLTAVRRRRGGLRGTPVPTPQPC